MKQVFLIFLVFLIGALNLHGQTKKQTRKERIKISEELILNLDKGALLVRISKRQRTIDALIAMGNQKKPRTISKKINGKKQSYYWSFQRAF